ncbi:glycoside hydrolase family 2 protein [Bacteroidota bacterium]
MKKVLALNSWKTKIYPRTDNKNKVPKDFLPFKKWIDAVVPGTVHTDLLNNKLIDDPFYSDNESKLYWINEVDWIYETFFDYPDNFEKEKPVKIVFEGLDTIAKVYLNKKEIGSSNNMFMRYEYETGKLKSAGNKLMVVFESPVKYSRKLEKKYGTLDSTRNSERAYIRKAQYSFGWDWGPAFPTMGIWRPVYLLQEDKAVITNIKFDTLQTKSSKAVVQVSVRLNGHLRDAHKLKINFVFEGQKIVKEVKIKNKKNHVLQLDIDNPKLWYPNGSGEQNLYELHVGIMNKKGEFIDREDRKVGIRIIELKLKEKGKNVFKFIVNNKPVYCKGADWIPADSFLPRVTKEKYRTLLIQAKDANMNMIRVWGGGIYEDKIFYELCDELGLLVWQDFMFACASYPGHKEYIKNVKEEIAHIINELQYHPSIAVWCGNNENEWIWYRSKFTSYKEMPGYKIYHEIIPPLMAKHDPMRPYWPSSPYGYEEDPNSVESGNRHVWDVWSYWVDYTEVIKDKSLFVTEFGFQAPANIDTLNGCLPIENRKSQDEIFEFHNKQKEGPERLFRFISAHFPVKTEWEDFIYLTQLNQAFALKTCLGHWRTNGITMGSIIWQINDCWPVTSWAVIDSNLMPKISYHFVKNVFSPVIAHFTVDDEMLNVTISNQGESSFTGSLKLTNIECLSGNSTVQDKSKLVIKAGQSVSVRIGNQPNDSGGSLLVASLYDDQNNLVHRDYYPSKRWKHLKMREAEYELNINDIEKTITLKAESPLLFMDFYHPGITFSDRGFIMLAGEKKVVKYTGKAKLIREKIKIFSLDKYLHK